MKKFMIQIFFLAVLAIGAFYVTSNPGVMDSLLNPLSGGTATPNNAPAEKKISKATIGTLVLNVETADTPDKRAKGLGGRQSLAADTGMIFLFPKADKYRFWMKGMLIPIDIIWFKGDVIVDLLPNVQPPTSGTADGNLPLYAPNMEVDKVLEVNAGVIDKSKIKIGDKVTFE